MKVVDDTAAEASDLATTGSAPRVLGGLILPPEFLRTKLPEVASAVNNAIRSSTRIRYAPVHLQPEVTPHTTQHGKRQHTLTYNKHAQHVATQKKLMAAATPQRKKKIQNLRQYQRKFKCCTCNVQFPTKEDLKSHNQLKHQHTCNDCKIEYSTKEQLQDHKCMFCKICNKLYSNSYSTYITHFRKYHYKPKFTCFACEEHFNNKDTLTVYRESYVAFYAHCPKCNQRFTSFLCYECGEAYPNMDDLSKHTHGLENKCSVCKAEFEHDFLLASHMRTHSCPVKTYTKKAKVNEITKDIERQEITEPEDTKVEEHVNAKEIFYKADGERESIDDLEINWTDDAVKQEPDDIKRSDQEVKIETDESDELSVNNGHGQTNMLDKCTFDKTNTDGVKKEQENWYEFNIEPTEIHFVSEVQRPKNQRTIIICVDSDNMNEKMNNSLIIVKEEPYDSNKETGVEASKGTGPCLVKVEPPEVPDGVVSSETCFALPWVKTECTYNYCFDNK
ncbi:zinc finger protein 518A-like [Cydia amplana]|uniref:zinc finger protein 518A-like n=1 Tax=Cydia amplana TaxID=1869771 RepID=UPI002FE62EE3